jgi:polar amino acid transport system substrate-binding protein
MGNNSLNMLFKVCFFSVFFSTLVHGKPLSLVTSEGPPHTINNKLFSGIDLDVAKAVLAELGYSVELNFVALGRAEMLVRSGQYDLMAPIFFAKDSDNFYISDPIVTYKPMVFSLSERNLSPDSISDLAKYAVITFQGAPGYFGDEFKTMSKQARYKESADMSVIPEMLAKSRYDFAVLDQYIFYYFYRLNDKKRPINIFKHHYLIPPVTASVAFKDKMLRDRFNFELKKFKQGKGYAKIVEAYLGRMEQVALTDTQ